MLSKLKGETNYLEGEHSKAREDFKEQHANKQVNEYDVAKGLVNTDPTKYTTMMTDLAMGADAGAEPIWAKLPFLERGSLETNKDKEPK